MPQLDIMKTNRTFSDLERFRVALLWNEPAPLRSRFHRSRGARRCAGQVVVEEIVAGIDHTAQLAFEV